MGPPWSISCLTILSYGSWIHGSYSLGFFLDSYSPFAHLLSLFHSVEAFFFLSASSSFLDV